MLSSLDKPMTKEESYVQRRQLFKNIWDTALRVDGKEDILAKPKVIKTLRMDEINECPIGKSKKQRIRNLRHVCNRILDFCNRQDADDQFYERIVSAGGADGTGTTPKPAVKHVKRLKTRVRRKYGKTKSMLIPNLRNITVARVAIKKSRSQSEVDKNACTSRSSPMPTKQKTPSGSEKRKPQKIKNEKSLRIKSADFPKEATSTKRKVVKKKRIGHGKKKTSKPAQRVSPQVICV